MDEAEQLCDRLMIIDHGRIVALGSPGELIAAHVTREVVEVRFALNIKEAAGAKLQSSDLGGDGDDPGPRVELLPDRVLIYADDGESALAAVHSMGLVPLTALVRRATLEDVFLKLTGRSLADRKVRSVIRVFAYWFMHYRRTWRSGSGRLGASDGQLPAGERELCRRYGQEHDRPHVRRRVVPAEGERNDAKAGRDGTSGNAHARPPTEVAVFPRRDDASHAGTRGRCPPPTQTSDSCVIGCVHRDASSRGVASTTHSLI
jgi:hypothetical protein